MGRLLLILDLIAPAIGLLWIGQGLDVIAWPAPTSTRSSGRDMAARSSRLFVGRASPLTFNDIEACLSCASVSVESASVDRLPRAS